MATVHLYFRTRLEADDVTAVVSAAQALKLALEEAGDPTGSITVVEDPPEEEIVTTPAVSNARAEGHAVPGEPIQSARHARRQKES